MLLAEMGWAAVLPDTATADNAPRFADSRRGHVESYFLRANHPTARRAIWLKTTILRPEAGPAVAEVWCVVFDGERGGGDGAGALTWGERRRVPLADDTFRAGRGLAVRIVGCEFMLAANGHSTGALRNERGSCDWALRWQPADCPSATPLCLFPTRRMIDGGFPRSKLLTPHPLLRFSGELQVGGERIAVDDWIGMQGHNWGREHAWEYVWGQCCFVGRAGEPVCWTEGFTSRIKLAGIVMPRMSSLVVRRGARSYRFDRIFDPWRQVVEISDLSWTVRLRSRDGEALLSMAARPQEVACLGYQNPDGHVSTCLNSKLASACLRVNPVNEEGFECYSEHGGALEFLQPSEDSRFVDVI